MNYDAGLRQGAKQVTLHAIEMLKRVSEVGASSQG